MNIMTTARFSLFQPVILATASILASLLTASSAAQAAAPEPLARWTFDVDARDQIGSMDGELFGGAHVLEGRLVLNGSDAWLATPPLPVDLTAKTLAATVRLASLHQGGGGVLTVESLDGQRFDSIVFGEREPGKWMAGSEDWNRTTDLPGPAPEDDPRALVHLAIVYGGDGTIAVYRNGAPYGPTYGAAPATYAAGNGRVLLGLRHSPEGEGKFFWGEIQMAELYGVALSASEVAGLAASAVPDQPLPEPSIARVWNEEILNAIRIDLPHPPVHARNLFSLSAAMYDAWAAYDPVAVGFAYRGKHSAVDVEAARAVAISHAAHRILRERYALSQRAETTLSALGERMAALGHDPENNSLDPSTPEGVGNLVAAAVSAWFLGDGSRQAMGYQDLPPEAGGYSPANGLLDTARPGAAGLVDVSRWQPLLFTDVIPISQSGTIIVNRQQSFLGSHWLGVRPFATPRASMGFPGVDPGPPPRFGGPGRDEFRSNVVAVIRASSELTTMDGATLNISPGAWGNHSLGANDGSGHWLNPATGLRYAANVVKRGDFARVLAEFWADGPHSETPPGHWNSLANQVSDRLGRNIRIAGGGPPVGRLEWDVKLYFALNAALHDAACAAWSLKRHYDGWRPISAIRHMASLGQCDDPNAPSHHPDGLPLIPGLIELVSAETSGPGGRHEGIPENTIAIRAWSNPTAINFLGWRWLSPPEVGWIRASEWFPYQSRGFVTPAFPGYVSGHSAFSRAGAEVLAAFTGSEFFPGGLGSFTAPAGSLGFSEGPDTRVTLQWGTYFDAADQAGLSRIWGGIHPPADDFAGRRVGAVCGLAAWSLARQFFDGTVASRPAGAALAKDAAGNWRLHVSTVRGLFYRVQAGGGVDAPFSDVSSGRFQARESQFTLPVQLEGPAGFFKILQADRP